MSNNFDGFAKSPSAVLSFIYPRFSPGQAYSGVLLCTPHSSRLLRVHNNAQSHSVRVGPGLSRLAAGRAARLRRAFEKASIRMPDADLKKRLPVRLPPGVSPKIGKADRPEAEPGIFNQPLNLGPNMILLID
jgi:hypothetical protein